MRPTTQFTPIAVDPSLSQLALEQSRSGQRMLNSAWVQWQVPEKPAIPQGQPQVSAGQLGQLGQGGGHFEGDGHGHGHTPPSPTTAPTGKADWLEYANQGAIRNQKLSDDLVSKLGFLGDMGVRMQVFSGGQDAEGPNRTGSHRHDRGGAADAFFFKDGRQLDWAKEADLPIFQEIARRAWANGVRGLGAGEGYMRPGSMHIGLGNEALWGAGGKGANVAPWLKQSIYG